MHALIYLRKLEKYRYIRGLSILSILRITNYELRTRVSYVRGVYYFTRTAYKIIVANSYYNLILFRNLNVRYLEI